MNREQFVTGLVLAAGGSSRLGRPKQLLPYRSGTLLDHTLNTARACDFDQLLGVIGADEQEIRDRVDLHGADIVVNDSFGEGCSSSIAAALLAVDPRCDVLVLLLGDQPGVSAATVSRLLVGRAGSPLAACAYDDGRGHPLAFARSMFDGLGTLHGDKGVWRLLDRHADQVVDVPVPGPIPRDVDTYEDYRALLARQLPRFSGGRLIGRRSPWSVLPPVGRSDSRSGRGRGDRRGTRRPSTRTADQAWRRSRSARRRPP